MLAVLMYAMASKQKGIESVSIATACYVQLEDFAENGSGVESKHQVYCDYQASCCDNDCSTLMRKG